MLRRCLLRAPGHKLERQGSSLGLGIQSSDNALRMALRCGRGVGWRRPDGEEARSWAHHFEQTGERKECKIGLCVSEGEEDSVLGMALFWSLLVVTGHEDTRVALSA